jgi:hypothetical protein
VIDLEQIIERSKTSFWPQKRLTKVVLSPFSNWTTLSDMSSGCFAPPLNNLRMLKNVSQLITDRSVQYNLRAKAKPVFRGRVKTQTRNPASQVRRHGDEAGKKVF